MNQLSLLSDEFFDLVGVRSRIPVEIVKDLRSPEGVRIGGCASVTNNKICIGAGYTNDGFLSIYLHEVAHFIASKTGLSSTHNSDCHTAYFATLVAVMYRRSKLIDDLKIYDFADDNASDEKRLEKGVTVSDAELVRRFRYIITRSAFYAPTKLSIEEIAEDIYKRDVKPLFDPPAPKRKPSKPVNWLDVALGALLGFGATGCAALFAASLKIL